MICKMLDNLQFTIATLRWTEKLDSFPMLRAEWDN